jgi:hypothetical protein
MGWMKSILEIWNRLTGVTGRRIKALRHANDWAETVDVFIKAHGLQDDANVEKFMGKSGDIKFEITTLIYSGRVLTEQSSYLKNKQVVRIIEEIVETLESIRRYLFSPALQKDRLRKAITILPLAVAQLQKGLADIAGQ